MYNAPAPKPPCRRRPPQLQGGAPAPLPPLPPPQLQGSSEASLLAAALDPNATPHVSDAALGLCQKIDAGLGDGSLSTDMLEAVAMVVNPSAAATEVVDPATTMFTDDDGGGNDDDHGDY